MSIWQLAICFHCSFSFYWLSCIRFSDDWIFTCLKTFVWMSTGLCKYSDSLLGEEKVAEHHHYALRQHYTYVAYFIYKTYSAVLMNVSVHLRGRVFFVFFKVDNRCLLLLIHLCISNIATALLLPIVIQEAAFGQKIDLDSTCFVAADWRR